MCRICAVYVPYIPLYVPHMCRMLPCKCAISLVNAYLIMAKRMDQAMDGGSRATQKYGEYSVDDTKDFGEEFRKAPHAETVGKDNLDLTGVDAQASAAKKSLGKVVGKRLTGSAYEDVEVVADGIDKIVTAYGEIRDQLDNRLIQRSVLYQKVVIGKGENKIEVIFDADQDVAVYNYGIPNENIRAIKIRSKKDGEYKTKKYYMTEDGNVFDDIDDARGEQEIIDNAKQ